MSDRPTDNFSGNTDFDRRGEGQGPTQRQEQCMCLSFARSFDAGSDLLLPPS